MDVTCQEVRGRASRSRKDASNKENVCPIQGGDPIAAETTRRRSPLPEGFPRSPLQDITHIICPHNIWPDNEDLETDQVRKKFRKDNSSGSCTANVLGSNSSWKGLAPCVHVKFGTKVAQIVVMAKGNENSKQSTDVEAVEINNEAKVNEHEQDLCIHRDDVSNDAISLPNCEIKGVQDAKSGEQSKQIGALDTQAHIIQHRKISAEECHADKKQSINGKGVQTIVGKENHNKRLQQPTQLRKKSSLLMFR